MRLAAHGERVAIELWVFETLVSLQNAISLQSSPGDRSIDQTGAAERESLTQTLARTRSSIQCNKYMTVHELAELQAEGYVNIYIYIYVYLYIYIYMYVCISSSRHQ